MAPRAFSGSYWSWLSRSWLFGGRLELYPDGKIDDEPKLAALPSMTFEHAGYTVRTAA